MASLGFNRRPADRRGGVRLSLLSLLLVTTCVALGLGLWLTHQRAERYRAAMSRAFSENQRLRDEYGEFEVTDPSLLYAVMMHKARRDFGQQENRDWAWRVSVPEGTPLTLRYFDGVIGFKGYPQAPFDQPLDPGVHTIRLSFRYNPDRPPGLAWQAHLSIRSRLADRGRSWSTTRTIKASAWPSLTGDGGPMMAIYLPDEGIAWGRSSGMLAPNGYDPSKRLVLQRMRVQAIDRKYLPVRTFSDADIPGFDVKADAPGFIVWIEPSP